MASSRKALAVLLVLAVLCVTSLAADTWRGKVAPAVLRWIDSGSQDERTVLVRLQTTGGDSGANSYASRSHSAWLSGGRDATADVESVAAVQRTFSLARAGGTTWEAGLAMIYGLDLVLARGTADQIRQLAQRGTVLAVLDGAAAVPTPASLSGGGSSGEAVVPPAQLLAASSVEGDVLADWMASLAWRYIARQDIVISDDAGAALMLSGSTLALGAPSYDLVGLALSDADRQAIEAGGATISLALASAAWSVGSEETLTVASLAALLEAMNQTGADGAAIASVTLAGATRSLYVLLRSATGAGWASLGAPAPGTSTTADSLPRGAAPGEVAASRGTYEDRVVLEWQPAAGASTYEVLRSESPAGTYEPVGLVGEAAFRDDEVETCVQYSYVARSISEGGLGLESRPATGFVGLVPMPSPRITTDGGTYAATIVVQWTPVDGATSYLLMRTQPMSDRPKVPAQQYNVYAGSEPYFADTDVIVGQTYNYRVFARNGCGQSELSPQAQGMALYNNPPDPTRLCPPTWVESTRGRPYERVMVSWSAASGAEMYRVLRATDYRGPYVRVVETAKTSWEDVDVVLCGDYWYRIQSLAGGQESEPSAIMYGSFGYRPEAPERVHASVGTYANSIEISWMPMEDAEVYQVSRAPSKDGPFAVLAAGIAGTTYVDAGLIPGQEFWYKVRASNLCGCSGDRGAVYGATSSE